MRTLMTVFALLAAGLVAGAAPTEKKDGAPSGAYTRKAGDLDLKMVFKKDHVVAVHVDAGDVGCVMTCKYKRDKDGVYHCEVTNFEKKGDFPAAKEKGYKFSFKLHPKDKAIVLSDLTGDDLTDEQKNAVEGEYEKAAGD